MTYSKIRMPASKAADDALLAIMRGRRLVGIREEGELLHQTPSAALTALDEVGLIDGE